MPVDIGIRLASDDWRQAIEASNSTGVSPSTRIDWIISTVGVLCEDASGWEANGTEVRQHIPVGAGIRGQSTSGELQRKKFEISSPKANRKKK